jgi:hypothetical protein
MCGDDDKAIWGCGFDWRHKGKAACTYKTLERYARAINRPVDSLIEEGDLLVEAFRTCPHYYARSIFVGSVLEHLDDYRRGALGDVRDLPAAQLDYLRIAETESNTMSHSLTEDIE